MKTHFAITTAVLVCAPALLSAQPTPPTRDYLVLVASESVDRVALIRFGPGGAKVEKERYVGWAPTEVAGPHGLAVSPDKKHYFVSTAHGTPIVRNRNRLGAWTVVHPISVGYRSPESSSASR